MRRAILLLSLTISAIALCCAQGNTTVQSSKRDIGNDPNACQYELVINNNAYSITEQQPLSIDLGDHKLLTLTLQKKPLQHYTGNDLSFDYPSDLVLQIKTKGLNTIISLKDPGSYMLIMAVLRDAPWSNKSESKWERNMIEEYQSRQFLFDFTRRSSIKRHCAGTSVEGVSIPFQLGGEPFISELYAVPLQRHTLGLYGQYTLSSQHEATERFSQVLASLKTDSVS